MWDAFTNSELYKRMGFSSGSTGAFELERVRFDRKFTSGKGKLAKMEEKTMNHSKSGPVRVPFGCLSACVIATCAVLGFAATANAVLCIVPDDGSGTAQMPPNCSTGYLSPDDVT